MADRFEKFTERAKNVLTLAQAEAHGLDHNYIGTEHLLLGMIRERDGVAGKVLALLGVALDAARAEVVAVIGRGDHKVVGDISLTPRSKKVIELAIEEARKLGHNYVGTEHLLLGLLVEGEGIGVGVLESLGVGAAKTRFQVIKEIRLAGPKKPARAASGEKPLPEQSTTRDSVISCRIDSEDLEAIDALIEAGIRSTRSEAASWLIHAGIQANLDLFDGVYRTVAEIRRLREHAQEMAREIKERPVKRQAATDSPPAEDPPTEDAAGE